MSDLYTKIYNPDVLSCLANLSNDEVFTPPDIVNKMLDMLPQELFRSKNTTFLDPACKTGVFLREIAKRLIVGLENDIPNLHKRIEHILRNQLFGIAITELTSLISRRSVYCSKYPNSKFSVVQFDDAEGNIRFRKTKHIWRGKKCIFCSASKSEYGRDKALESHAYEFIHTAKPEEIFNMKFDVIIGNPPYQLSDGGAGASAIPIYHKFVEQAKKLNPRYLSMIIPARWYVGGRGLDSFRNEMLNDDRIRVLYDFPNASDCFPGVEIKGGVCFFLWNRENRGACEIHSYIGKDTKVNTRSLLEEGMDTFIRNPISISVLQKINVTENNSFSTFLKAGRHFGFHTKVTWQSDLIGTLQTADGQSSYPISSHQSKEMNTKVYIAYGECWISEKNVTRNQQDINKYKVIIPRSGNPGSTIIGKPKISEPGSCSSNTYIVMIPQENNLEAATRIVSYLQTRFVRFLIGLRTSTQDIAPKAYSYVPTQNFDEKWTDEKLYKKYGLSKDEITFIENMIPPMVLNSEHVNDNIEGESDE